MKRFLMLMILACMIISAHAIECKKNEELFHSYTSTHIDSVVIIYQSMELAYDDLKITVLPSCGDIRFVKRFFAKKYYDKVQDTSKPQKLCEWQRKEIFETIIGIYITGNIKIGTGKIPTQSTISATPPELYVSIYAGGNIRQEHLTIYHVDDDDDYKYSDRFEHLNQLLAALLLALRDNFPIIC